MRPVAAYGRRWLSTGRKVYAVPFKLTSDKARNYIDMTASVHKHPVWSAFKILGSIFTRQPPTASDHAQHLNYRPAYLPMWLYDVACTGKATFKATALQDEEKGTLTSPVMGLGMNCYWPGHSWSPLTYLSIIGPGIPQEEDLVEFNDSLTQVDGVEGEIEVIPFSRDPVRDILPRLTRLPARHLTLDDPSFSIDPSTVRVDHFAAYPIYWPVYVAEFDGPGDSEGSERRTILMGAHSNDPFVCQWEPSHQGTSQWINNGQWFAIDMTKTGLGHTSILRQFEQRLRHDFIDTFPFSPDEASNQPATPQFDHPSVQPYLPNAPANKKYLEAMYAYRAHQTMLSGLEQMKDDVKTVGLAKGAVRMQDVATVRRELQQAIQQAKGHMEQCRPPWMSDDDAAHDITR
ncbi:hypothetical protein BZG36_05167 [Bifiguratus adelaidae]|uniref:Uncharacterized protein n=1 Tax=Bifiguratus adelaidae TaxID=1938954 RepID=A0A261XTY9_9FUNG|nr:hypothetical protein BZG36_05167 [Bifiguratus adelaidae]